MRDWLRNLRIKNGYTMKEMGVKLGISESYYCAIESRERQKKMDMLLASSLATIFEIPIATIVSLDSAEHSQKEKDVG